MKWKSFAEWPDTTDFLRETWDLHDTEDQAKAVCLMLERDGLGGEREIFPVRTWVEPEYEAKGRK